MKRHMLLTMILLLSVSLLIPNIYATTANQQNSEIIANASMSSDTNMINNQITVDMQYKTASCQLADEAANDSKIKQKTSIITTPSLNTKNSYDYNSTDNIQYATAAAGDETYSNVQDNWFTTKNITEAADRVKTYIETNHKLPNYVHIGSLQINLPQFLQVLTTSLLHVNKGNNTPVTLKNVNTPTNSTENLKTGNINKTEYIDLAVRIGSYMDSTGKAPNFATSTLGKIGYESLVYLYSRIMGFYENNGTLPQYASIKPWENIGTNQTPLNETNGYTIAQISAAAGLVQTFIEENQRLPKYVQMGTKKVNMPQFLQLLNTGLLQINGNDKTPITLKSVGTPANPSEDLQNGNINKTEYLDLAVRIGSYLDSSGKAPNFATSTLGKIRYESLIYLESRILNFYGVNKVLPKYAAVNPWTSITSDPSSLSQYLQPTDNCQSNDQRIISLVKSVTAGKTSAYDKATALFNWVRDNVEYSFYYNTKYGAIGTLNSKKGNCVDHSHLLIALLRSAGIPARYEHGIVNFSDGTFGHVWAQVYVNGKWYIADPISSKNSFGIINNWDTSDWTLVGIYAELPF